MDEDREKEMQELRGKIADDLGYQQKNQGVWRHRGPLNYVPDRRFLILGGAGMLILMVLIALFSGSGDKLSTGDLGKILAGLDRLGQRLTLLEGVAERVELLEKQGKEMRRSFLEADRSGRDLAGRLDELAQRFDRLQERMASAEVRAKGLPSIQRKPTPLGKRRYHEVRSGENLYRIARQYGVSVHELCRLNDITPGQVIYPGQRLLVAPDGSE